MKINYDPAIHSRRLPRRKAFCLALAFVFLQAFGAHAEDITVTGRVIDVAGEPAPDAVVTLRPLKGSGGFTAETEADGRFRFTTVPAGRYRLQAEADGFRSPAVDRAFEASENELELALTMATIESEIIVSSGLPELATSLRISASQIADAGDKDLGEYLREVSGVSAVRRGPLNLEPTIRGLQEEQVGMFVDGTRTFAAGPARMDSNISHVDPHSVESLRVVKGPYALTWGAGTLSALSVETSRPPIGNDDVRGTVGLDYGESSGSTDGYVDVGHGHDRWTWHLSASHREGDDYEAGDGSTVPADYESTNLRTYWAVELPKNVLFQYTGGYQEQFDIDYAGRILDATYFYTRNNAVDLTWSGEDGPVREVYGQFYSNRKDHRMNNDEKPTAQPAPGRIPPFGIDVDLPTESNTTGGRFRVRTEGERVAGTFGVDFYRLEQTASRTVSRRSDGRILFEDIVWPDAEIEDLGAYAQVIYRTDRAELGATVRLDDVDATAGRLSDFFRQNAPGDPDQSETNASAAVSARFDLGEHWTLTAGVGRAVRTATILERYSDRFPSTKFQIAAEFLGNPELDPESSLEWNLGGRGRYGDVLVEIEGFYREIDDYITVIPDPDVPRRLPLSPPTVFRYVNGDRATFYGGELLVSHRAHERFLWRGSLSYVRAEDETFDEPVLGIAPLHGEVGGRFFPLPGRLWIDLAARFSDRQDRVATSRFEQETPGFTVFDLALDFDLGKGFTLRARVDNLGDKAYAHHLNSPNPFTRMRVLEEGRSVHLGFTYRYSAVPPGR